MALLFCLLAQLRPSQIADLAFPDHPGMAVDLALDLILEQASRLGQLAHDNEHGAGLSVLAQIGAKRRPSGRP